MAVAASELTINNNISQIGLVSAMIEQLGVESNLVRDDVLQLMLAAEEVITNTINYGYDDKKEHEIFVKVVLDNHLMRVEIRDDAAAFNPLEVPPPDSLELPALQRSPGGLGIHLVRQLTDRIIYKREKNRNILTLEKKVTSANASQH